MVELSNKKILLLGASGNIGCSTAIKLSQLGAQVVISGRDVEKLKKIISLLEGEGHYYIPFDISDIDSFEDLMHSAVSFDNKKEKAGLRINFVILSS